MAKRKKLRTYLIPVRRTKTRRAMSKAHVDVAWDVDNQRMVPMPGATLVQIQAATAADAFRLLCQDFLPGDPRPIAGKSYVAGCVVRTKEEQQQNRLLKDVAPEEFLIACDYVESELGLTVRHPTDPECGPTAYLRNHAPAQEKVLRDRIAHQLGRNGSHVPHRGGAFLYQESYLEAVLKFLVGKNWIRYIEPSAKETGS